MKINVLSLLTILCVSAASLGATNLPYIGPEAESCKINRPDTGLDNGYIASEDCKVIYVKPPSFGLISEVGRHSSISKIVCESVINTAETLATVIKREKELSKEHQCLIEYGGREAKERLNEIREFISLLQDINADNISYLKEIGGNETVDTVQLLAESEWSYLIRLYQETNMLLPGVSFRELPLAAGIISADTKVQDKKGLISELDSIHPVVKAEVLGMKLSEINWTNIVNSPIPMLLSSQTNKNYIVGKSANMKIELNLVGACGDVANPNNENGVHLSPTYTYFYPVQTKSFFKVIVNAPDVVKLVHDLLDKSKDGTLSRDSFLDQSKAGGSFKVEINPGLFSNASTQDLETRAEAVRMLLADQLFSSMSTKVEMARQNSFENVSSQHRRKVCHSTWLGLGKSCHDHVYTVTQSVFNKQKLLNQVATFHNEQSEASGGKYINLLMYDTSGYIGEKAYAQKRGPVPRPSGASSGNNGAGNNNESLCQ